jgi:hypothetical protein
LAAFQTETGMEALAVAEALAESEASPHQILQEAPTVVHGACFAEAQVEME